MSNENKNYQYGLLARPYLPGSSQPAGEKVVENFKDSGDVFEPDRKGRAGRKVHAVVEYDRPLEDWEIRRYSLHPIDSE